MWLLFIKEDNSRKIGTVGALQFDVIQFRLEHEYGANVLITGWCTKLAG